MRWSACFKRSISASSDSFWTWALLRISMISSNSSNTWCNSDVILRTSSMASATARGGGGRGAGGGVCCWGSRGGRGCRC